MCSPPLPTLQNPLPPGPPSLDPPTHAPPPRSRAPLLPAPRRYLPRRRPPHLRHRRLQPRCRSSQTRTQTPPEISPRLPSRPPLPVQRASRAKPRDAGPGKRRPRDHAIVNPCAPTERENTKQSPAQPTPGLHRPPPNANQVASPTQSPTHTPQTTKVCSRSGPTPTSDTGNPVSSLIRSR